MDIQLADRLLAKTNEIVTLLTEIDSQISKIAPDLNSNIQSKKNIIMLLNGLNLLKEDISDFREGKEIINTQKIMKEKLQSLLGNIDGTPRNNSGMLDFKSLFGDKFDPPSFEPPTEK